METLIDKGNMAVEVHSLTDEAMELEVIDQKTFDYAVEYVVKLATMKKTVKNHYRPLKEAANKAHKAITQQEKDDLSPILNSEQIVQDMILIYEQAQEKERKRLQDIEDEKARKSEDAKKKRLDKKIDKEECPEKKTELEEKKEDVYTAPAIVESTVKKSTKVAGGGGTTFVKDIEVSVIDSYKFLQAIVNKELPLNLIELKLSQLKKYCKISDKKDNEVPGVFIKETKRISTRSGK